MIQSISTEELCIYVSKQLNSFFPDNDPVDLTQEKEYVIEALNRIEFCFKHVSLKNYYNNNIVNFNHLYSDHYVMFIWYLSNTVYFKKGKCSLANKLYYLNKTLHGLDCMFDTQMPNIFLLFHGVGTMLGKATYSDYFVALQGCTIGSHRGKYPIIGKGVSLTAHSSIIGNCKIGDRVSISAYTSVFEKDIPPDTLVFKNNNSGIVENKTTNNSYSQQFFNIDFNTL